MNQYIRIEEVILNLNEDENNVLQNKTAKILGIKNDEIIEFNIIKKAIDSRNKNNILFVYIVDVKIENQEMYFEKNKKNEKNIIRHKIRFIEPFIYNINKINSSKLKKRPIVVGTGPSGLFCGLALALAGANPIILERGSRVEERVVQVHNFFTKRELNPNSNVQFGEGGAGTFSDGKLYTLVNDPRSKFIFEEFVKAGAPKEILYSARPHIGTDRLRGVVRNMRKKIIELGGEIRFDTLMTDIIVVDGKIKGVKLQNGDTLETNDLVLGIGHSARDTCEMLYNRGLEIIGKPFAIGVRIEHPRELINKSQFGESCNNIKLPTANYKLVSHHEKNRSVYSFCMCPGGLVVNASSEKGKLTVNGMSEYAQNSINSNSALLVNVMTSDFGSDHPLAGIEFQRFWEEKAFIEGGSNYDAPAQLVGDFLAGVPSKKLGSIETTFKPNLKMTSIDKCLPEFVTSALREAIPLLDRKIKGFAHKDAILIGIEARTSAVVRFVRDKDTCESNIIGVYPSGEGAGYAGGITSSAIDGLIVSESLIKKYS
nr:hypothetical protein [Candidatus Gracilibacteria bacterium]